MVGRVADDLGPALVARVGRESVFEDRDVVVGLGDLGLGLTWPRRAQGAVLRGRMVGAVLAPRCDRDPLLEQRIPTQLAQIFFS